MGFHFVLREPSYDASFLSVINAESLFTAPDADTRDAKRAVLEQLGWHAVALPEEWFLSSLAVDTTTRVLKVFQCALQYLHKEEENLRSQFDSSVAMANRFADERDSAFEELVELRETVALYKKRLTAASAKESARRKRGTPPGGEVAAAQLDGLTCTLCGNAYPSTHALHSHYTKRHKRSEEYASLAATSAAVNSAVGREKRALSEQSHALDAECVLSELREPVSQASRETFALRAELLQVRETLAQLMETRVVASTVGSSEPPAVPVTGASSVTAPVFHQRGTSGGEQSTPANVNPAAEGQPPSAGLVTPATELPVANANSTASAAECGAVSHRELDDVKTALGVANERVAFLEALLLDSRRRGSETFRPARVSRQAGGFRAGDIRTDDVTDTATDDARPVALNPSALFDAFLDDLAVSPMTVATPSMHMSVKAPPTPQPILQTPSAGDGVAAVTAVSQGPASGHSVTPAAPFSASGSTSGVGSAKMKRALTSPHLQIQRDEQKSTLPGSMRPTPEDSLEESGDDESVSSGEIHYAPLRLPCVTSTATTQQNASRASPPITRQPSAKSQGPPSPTDARPVTPELAERAAPPSPTDTAVAKPSHIERHRPTALLSTETPAQTPAHEAASTRSSTSQSDDGRRTEDLPTIPQPKSKGKPRKAVAPAADRLQSQTLGTSDLPHSEVPTAVASPTGHGSPKESKWPKPAKWFSFLKKKAEKKKGQKAGKHHTTPSAGTTDPVTPFERGPNTNSEASATEDLGGSRRSGTRIPRVESWSSAPSTSVRATPLRKSPITPPRRAMPALHLRAADPVVSAQQPATARTPAPADPLYAEQAASGYQLSASGLPRVVRETVAAARTSSLSDMHRAEEDAVNLGSPVLNSGLDPSPDTVLRSISEDSELLGGAGGSVNVKVHRASQSGSEAPSEPSSVSGSPRDGLAKVGGAPTSDSVAMFEESDGEELIDAPPAQVKYVARGESSQKDSKSLRSLTNATADGADEGKADETEEEESGSYSYSYYSSSTPTEEEETPEEKHKTVKSEQVPSRRAAKPPPFTPQSGPGLVTPTTLREPPRNVWGTPLNVRQFTPEEKPERLLPGEEKPQTQKTGSHAGKKYEQAKGRRSTSTEASPHETPTARSTAPAQPGGSEDEDSGSYYYSYYTSSTSPSASRRNSSQVSHTGVTTPQSSGYPGTRERPPVPARMQRIPSSSGLRSGAVSAVPEQTPSVASSVPNDKENAAKAMGKRFLKKVFGSGRKTKKERS